MQPVAHQMWSWVTSPSEKELIRAHIFIAIYVK